MRRLGWLGAVLFLGAWDPVTHEQRDVAEGNKHLAEGKPAEAEAAYRKALETLPGMPAVLFDLGAAHYRQAQAAQAGEDRKKLLDSAEKEFRLAGDAPDTKLRASAHYNLGNTLFDQEKYKDAVEEYKKSLKLDPAREEARHNLELALVKIPPPPPSQGGKDQKKQPPSDQQQQQQQQQQSGQGDQKDQKDQKDQNDQKQADAQQQDQQQQQGQGQEQQQKDQSQQQQASPDKDQKDSKDQRDQKSAQAGQPEKPGEEDMERKLDALERRSKDLQVGKAQEHARDRRRGKVAKDW